MKRHIGYLIAAAALAIVSAGTLLAEDYYQPWVRTQQLTATAGTITTLGSTTGTIATLGSTTGTITTLGSTTANVSGLATVGQLKIGTAYEGAAAVTIALAKSLTTDGMTITVTVTDKAGAAIAKPFPLLLWMSEAATCAGLTADTYSGTLTAGTGILLQTITAKTTFMIQTAATGVFVGTLVDSANPVDQYVCVAHPVTATPVASAVSGTNWEGA